MATEGDGLSTLLNHPPRSVLGKNNSPTISPIYQTAKFAMSAEMPYSDQFLYTRVSNPTLRDLELTLAKVQGTEDGIVFSSGMAAISHTLMGLLQAGDHVLYFRELYKPARMFLKDLKRYGISGTMLKLSDEASLEASVIPGKTKLLYFESPTNPNLGIADIPKLKSFCQKNNLLLVMDNTFAGPHQHHGLGVDLFIHSLTKFVNGHGDVIAGAVLGSTELIKKIKPMAVALGATLDPHAAFLIQRGFRTYLLRYQKQTENARDLVAYLRAHKKIKTVYYPDGELAKKQLADSGAMVSFELHPTHVSAKDFCHRLTMVQLAVSLGSAETIIAPTEIFFAEDLEKQDREEMGLTRHSLRVSVGLEDIKDIIADFEQALK